MNVLLEEYARDWLRVHACRLTDEQRHVFKRMYSHEDLSADMEKVIASMPKEKLDWAMMQVNDTIKKNGRQGL
jgi:hypothetical protein